MGAEINSILDDTPAHILVSGHSGAGKSTLARALSAELKLPVAQVDRRPEFNEFLAQNTPDNHLPAGAPKHEEFRRLLQATALKTIQDAKEPSVIEGAQLAYLPPELLAKFRRVHVNPERRQIYNQRLARTKQRYLKDPTKQWTPEVEVEKKRVADLVYGFHGDAFNNYDKLPGTLKYKPGQDIKTLLQKIHQKQAELNSAVQLQDHQQRISDRVTGEDPRMLVYHGLGSGKSLSALAAAEAAKTQFGDDYGVVVPASLRGNFQKEINKFTTGSTPEIMSYTGLALGKNFQEQPETLVIDEAHRLRNPRSGASRATAQAAASAKRLMLLTGSPITNSPSDMANLLALLHNKQITPEEFENRYVGYKTVRPGIMGWLRGAKPGVKPVVKNEAELRALLKGKVDYQPSKTPDGVNVQEEQVKVPLSAEQQKIQKAIRTKIPPGFLWKLDQEFPLSRDELAKLNSFMTGMRQVSLSTQPFRADKDPAKAFTQSAKLQRAFEDLRTTLKEDKRKKAIIYSNFVDSGLSPYASALEKAKIPHAFFHGGVSPKARQAAVDAYNAGKLRALLIGPAGAEGLSTKGTSLIQLLDPHWHESRSQQAKGRGLRFDSHVGLPEELKNVAVKRYLSSSQAPGMLGKLMGYKRERTGDEVLERLTAEKEQINEEFRRLLREEGDTYRQQQEQEKLSAAAQRLFHGTTHGDLKALQAHQPNTGAAGIYGADNLDWAALYALAKDRRGMAVLGGAQPKLLINKANELAPEGYVYEYLANKVTPPPNTDPNRGWHVSNNVTPTRQHIVKLIDHIKNIEQFDDKESLRKRWQELNSKTAAAAPPDFQPDYTPGQLHGMGVYKSLYEQEGPRLASLGEWKPEWVTEHDPKGWLEWYQNYNSGRRIPDEDMRQIKRWASFKSRHGGPFVKNPSPRRGWALRNWAINPEKLVSKTQAGDIKTMLQEYQEQELKKYLKKRPMLAEKTSANIAAPLKLLQKHVIAVSSKPLPKKKKRLLQYVTGLPHPKVPVKRVIDSILDDETSHAAPDDLAQQAAGDAAVAS